MRFTLVFLGSSITLFCLLYFYPTELFSANLGNAYGQISANVSLYCLLHHTQFPEGILAENITIVKPAFTSYMLLFVFLIGLPFMLAYRFSKSTAKNKENT